jgi:hypothetical protein
MMDDTKQWEKELVNPLLWDEGEWNFITREIHRDLMNNQPVKVFAPTPVK